MSGRAMHDVQTRLQRLDLPAAPDGLRARVAAITAAPPRATSRVSSLAQQGRFLVPLAAILLIGALAISNAGKGKPPSATPDGSIPSSVPAGPAHAALTVRAADYEFGCVAMGCEYIIQLSGPGGPWAGELSGGEIGSQQVVVPRLPEQLSDGDYTIEAVVNTYADAIGPEDTGPPFLGIANRCSSTFSVGPGTTVVEVTLGFWMQRCAAGTVVADDPATLASFEVIPTIAGACGADVGGCDYRVALTGPGGRWEATVQTVKHPDQLAINEIYPMLPPGQYRLEATSYRMSTEPQPGVGFQSELGVAGTCASAFTVEAAYSYVGVDLQYVGELCTVETSVQVLATEPPGPVGPVATLSPTTPVGSQSVTCHLLPARIGTCAEAVAAIEATLGTDEPGSCGSTSAPPTRRPAPQAFRARATPWPSRSRRRAARSSTTSTQDRTV